MPSGNSSVTKSSTKTDQTDKTDKRLSAYKPNFEGHLVRHGIYSTRYRHADHRAALPANFEEIQKKTACRQGITLS